MQAEDFINSININFEGRKEDEKIMVNLVLQVQHSREGQEVGCVCPGKIILIK